MQIPASNLTAPKILIAPLDWGLGHATRCIPIIRTLKQKNCEIVIAASGINEILLKKEFPDSVFLPLEGYQIHYSKYRWGLAFKLLIQLKTLKRKIEKEHVWLQAVIEQYKIDVVISDNRFGLFTSKIPCIFITHQLQIVTPFGLLERLIQKINYHYINQYTTCWIPDNASGQNLAGRLSHPSVIPGIPLQYIGPLVRFPKPMPVSIEFDVCIVLSGPEPQRTILENILLKQVVSVHKKVVLVRGLPGKEEIIAAPFNTIIHNYLTETELLNIIVRSNLVICRSGYTTVMEMMYLQKKTILIPTPGQTEQEYLAEHLSKQNFCVTYLQHQFVFSKAVEQALSFNYIFPDMQGNTLNKTVADFLSALG
ncbi:MAG: glycosyl transferase family 28 [Sphingobacteriia bacterium]|nr:glycosyl transferase family 28 [Sphingobacteriia bacterium]